MLPQVLEKLALSRADILHDYRLAVLNREASRLGYQEVMLGKAQFGIFGDGKELPQLAWARAFRKGDWRTGYYRDQTFMMAIGELTLEQFFAQLYGHADVQYEPACGGRNMNNHFGTRLLNPDGTWKPQTEHYNVVADVSPTGSQMPRLVGLALASKLYRELDELHALTQFSRNGDEVAWASIGNATCAEGMFWETLNAIGVLQVPAVISVWDDEYGISVPNEYQLTKDLYQMLQGFQRQGPDDRGFEVRQVKGWDYPALLEVYQEASRIARAEHVPVILHVVELVQPSGHSTSGSHTRYKSRERLEWEAEHDGLRRFRAWILEQGLASEEELDTLEKEAKREVRKALKRAHAAFVAPRQQEAAELARLLEEAAARYPAARDALQALKAELQALEVPYRAETLGIARRALLALRAAPEAVRAPLIRWRKRVEAGGRKDYGTFLYSPWPSAATQVPEIKPTYAPDAPEVAGFEVLNKFFDLVLGRDPRVIAFGEDVGHLGGVNQAFRGLQAKYGKWRVMDTGIREATILGQAIGLALRGLRPIAEIQYLDYLLYALQIMSDDLATVLWRSAGGQKAPVIVRTRGHRLVGIWHAGSLMAGLIHLVRGMHVLVPRDMTRAAGFYNTLLQGDEPGIVVEVLNGYRLKEKLPANLGEFTVPLGVPEIVRPGRDVTLVTYGAMVRIVLQAAEDLAKVGIDAEVIDVQSLLPFDVRGVIVESLRKTNRVVFLDEDVPGGTTAYMMQEVLEKQDGYQWLDSPPLTVPARPHRPAYGFDGDYFSKPNVDEVFYKVYGLFHELNPRRWPLFFEEPQA
ncbi:MAG: transketolase [Chloroflexi bacterium]|nr:transketolase [Chloroflexota bacterium]